MEIAEAIQICKWQDFWNTMITEFTITNTSSRHHQELWVRIRLKIITELQSFEEPFDQTLKRFQQTVCAHTYHQHKKRQIIKLACLTDKVEKKLVALATIYNYLTKKSED